MVRTTTKRMWGSLLAAVAAVVLVGPSARAEEFIAGDTPTRAVWFRIGFTSEGHFSFSLAGESLPWNVGVELSPHSEAGLVRLFAGVKSNGPTSFFGSGCDTFLGFGAAAVVAFGPGRNPHGGLRLGAHLRNMKIADTPGEWTRAEGLSYDLSLLYDTGFIQFIHDGGFELGMFEQAKGFCSAD